MTTRSSSLRALRLRWALVGAAVAVLVGGISVSGATNSQVTPSKTGITPCRIMDTRASSQVGPRGTPLGLGTTHTIQVTGKNGNCTIPTDATGVVLNLTVANIGADGFITVYPADAPARPTASNVNYGIFQKPVANLVSATLSANGRLSFYSFNGPVDLVADITAYTTGARLSSSNLAQKRWDRDRARPASVAVGTSPGNAVYDGSSIWVSNLISSTVSRIDPVLNTVTATVPVAAQPNDLVFDGTFVWVTSGAAAVMSRIDPSTNTVTGTVTLPGGFTPLGAEFDGTNLWVARTGASAISKISPVTRTVLATVTVGAGPTSVTFDGTNIWSTNSGDDTVSKVNPSTGAVTTYPAGAGTGPTTAAFDGTNLWIVNADSNSVSRFSTASNTVTATVAVGTAPRYAAFDGRSLWVTNFLSDTISRIDAATGVVTATVAAPNPYGTVFDGTNLWAIDLDGGRVTKLRTN